MATEKAKPGDTILVKHNSWNSSWLIGFEFLVVKQARHGKSGEVTIRTKKGDYFVRHQDYKIVRRADHKVDFRVDDIVTWQNQGLPVLCKIVEAPRDKSTPANAVWTVGLDDSYHTTRPLTVKIEHLTLVERGGQSHTTTKKECCPDCKGTGRITMLNWDVDCYCVKPKTTQDTCSSSGLREYTKDSGLHNAWYSKKASAAGCGICVYMKAGTEIEVAVTEVTSNNTSSSLWDDQEFVGVVDRFVRRRG